MSIKSINPPRADGYPIINEIISDGSYSTDVKDEKFGKPLSELEKEY